MEPVIVWLRQDLRIADNPALHEAARTGAPVVPLFILDPSGEWAPGAASRVWLHHSLDALARSLERLGSPLVLRAGDSLAVLRDVTTATGASAVYWNRRYEPDGIACDTRVKDELKSEVRVESFNARLLFEPWHIATGSDTPYRVFTPFYRKCLRSDPPPEALPPPARLARPQSRPASLALGELELEPRIDWAAGIRSAWTVGEQGALAVFESFVDERLAAYPEARDFPARAGASRLSPHLHFGEISPRTLWHGLRSLAAGSASTALEQATEAWLRQLVWREFAYHVLYHFPATTNAPLRPEFSDLPWCDAPEHLEAWQQGKTGFPLVDAGMRELWRTGSMHNRVRMVVASFLCKHLGVHWLEGARWFWDTLVDADLANNTMGWQWSAGCGADAAPYFRIFNPVSQSRRFDGAGDYIRRWLPELEGLDDRAIHAPGAGGYLAPLIELKPARDAALARYAAIR